MTIDSSEKQIEEYAGKVLSRYGDAAESEILLRADAARRYNDRMQVDTWMRVVSAIQRLKAST